MTKPTEQEIEHVARAMCEADGHDPDLASRHPMSQGWGAKGWQDYAAKAKRFLAGHYAMKGWA